MHNPRPSAQTANRRRTPAGKTPAVDADEWLPELPELGLMEWGCVRHGTESGRNARSVGISVRTGTESTGNHNRDPETTAVRVKLTMSG